MNTFNANAASERGRESGLSHKTLSAVLDKSKVRDGAGNPELIRKALMMYSTNIKKALGEILVAE